MKHKLQKINSTTLDMLAFEEVSSNYEDMRRGSALAMVKHANDNALGGFTDWLLPSKETLLELRILVEVCTSRHWSSSPYVGNSGYAWVVYFHNGDASLDFRSSLSYVRLVRASQLYDIGLAALNKRFGVDK